MPNSPQRQPGGPGSHGAVIDHISAEAKIGSVPSPTFIGVVRTRSYPAFPGTLPLPRLVDRENFGGSAQSRQVESRRDAERTKSPYPMSSAGREEPNEALAFAVNYKNFRYSPPFSHCIKTPFEPRAFESGEVPQRRRPVVRCKLRDGPLMAVQRLSPFTSRGTIAAVRQLRDPVESRCGAVAVGSVCLVPPLSSGGARVTSP